MEVKLKLTDEEKNTLYSFIGECVMNNIVFPSNKIGVSNTTIQELIHERNIHSLKEFGKSINKRIADFDPDFSTIEAYNIGGIEGTKIVSVIKLIIKQREFEDYKVKSETEIKNLKGELENLKTPKEKRKQVEARLAELMS